MSMWSGASTTPPMLPLSPTAMWHVPHVFFASRIVSRGRQAGFVPMANSATFFARSPFSSSNFQNLSAAALPVMDATLPVLDLETHGLGYEA